MVFINYLGMMLFLFLNIGSYFISKVNYYFVEVIVFFYLKGIFIVFFLIKVRVRFKIFI